jgi:hypothetical protein
MEQMSNQTDIIMLIKTIINMIPTIFVNIPYSIENKSDKF